MDSYLEFIQSSFLSTLSLRRATGGMSERLIGSVISIHALLAESDAKRFPALHHIFISIHALLAESDCGCFERCRYWAYFYPSSPCGERRCLIIFRPVLASYFYPRSPCGERPLIDDVSTGGKIISIHALLAESDKRNFASDPPATRISIHALLAESDPRRGGR